ncbi:hypothetical protein [Pontibacter vulgaris]|uniref:hypothetical protein n=1 Tax=Pontibacter vulgaris TaxID=2905679 RepID=UPI001FA70AB5|nr:hypothetical protein [Pontibacter vulgaris]
MVEHIDFQINPADLQLMPAVTEGNKGSGLLWLLVLLGAIVLGLVLYLHFAQTPLKREKLVPDEL